MHTKFDRRGVDKIQKIYAGGHTAARRCKGAEKSALYFFVYMLDKIMPIYYNVITMTEGEYKDDK